MTRNVSILGSTGSIGTQALRVIAADPDFKVRALTANTSINTLFEQTARFRPDIVCVYNEVKAEQFASLFSATDYRPVIVSGMEGLIECAAYAPSEICIMALMGMIGVRPAIAAIQAGKTIALANKETLVTAGHLIMPMAVKAGVKVMPVDSEHSAIYQCLSGEPFHTVSGLILTASGGPFRKYRPEDLKNIRPSDALKHPNWSMGAKITIDSSTMANKALEVMEAHFLFDVPVKNIEIVIQPQSVIHSMVRFRDGSVKAQMGVPSMMIPIEYALYAPDRRTLPEPEELDFTRLKSIDFDVPDFTLFPCLRLGLEAALTGGSMGTVFNAANEEAVSLFLQEKIGYTEIAASIGAAMSGHRLIPEPSLEEVFKTEAESRAAVRERALCGKRK